jgi:REP element-mobilizing transposase RayT
MARPLRIDIEDGLYHVISRGWERRKIVDDDTDREKWLQLFGRVAERYDWRCFAWVLMDNHFHLLLRTPNADLSSGMHDFNSGYATWFNRRHQRVGSLYQGRFKAILVQDNSYAWTLSRYIHLNPVRAGISKSPQAYPWSSYRHFVASRGAPDWLDWRTVLDEMGQNRSRTRRAYRQFVENDVNVDDSHVFREVVGKGLLGTSEWVDRMRKMLGQSQDKNVPDRQALAWKPRQDEIEALVAEEFDVTTETLRSKRVRMNDARSVALYLIRKMTSGPASELAFKYGGVSSAAISKSVQRLSSRLAADAKLQKRVKRLESRLKKRC